MFCAVRRGCRLKSKYQEGGGRGPQGRKTGPAGAAQSIKKAAWSNDQAAFCRPWIPREGAAPEGAERAPDHYRTTSGRKCQAHRAVPGPDYAALAKWQRFQRVDNFRIVHSRKKIRPGAAVDSVRHEREGREKRGAREAQRRGGRSHPTGTGPPEAPSGGAGAGGRGGRTPPTTKAPTAHRGRRPGGAGQKKGAAGTAAPAAPPGPERERRARARGEAPPGAEVTEPRHAAPAHGPTQRGSRAAARERGPGAQGKQRGGPAPRPRERAARARRRSRRNAPGRGRGGGGGAQKAEGAAAEGGSPEQGRTPQRVRARWPPEGAGARARQGGGRPPAKAGARRGAPRDPPRAPGQRGPQPPHGGAAAGPGGRGAPAPGGTRAAGGRSPHVGRSPGYRFAARPCAAIRQRRRGAASIT